jgi:hypothetical protein
MRRTLRGSATAMVALVLAVGSGCAARGTGATQSPDLTAANPQASSDTSARPVAAGGKRAMLTQAAFSEDSDGARLVLSASTPLLYTAYDPRPNLLVIDLPNFSPAERFTAPMATGDLVSSIKVEPMTELGKSLTRVTIAYKEGARYDIRTAGEGLAVAFEVPGAAATLAENATPPVTAEALAAPAAMPAQAPADSVAADMPRGELAHSLEEVVVGAAGGGV